MRQFHDALAKLTKAIGEVEAVVEAMRVEHDRWRHTSSFHAANIGMPGTPKAESAAR